ncbi:MAG: serine/threonine-protein kinase [Rhodothermales bacterium]
MHDDQSILGTVIDGYRILEIIGKGGMGIVYKAEDIALSRIVALKMITPELAENETFLKRFRAEARALARVDSPYIVGIHAMRHSEQRFFIVMEYVEGGTLFDEISGGPMPPDAVGPIVRQMLLAFSNAHRVGVIHRDIKPRNIMLTPAGRVKVTDFGLAKLRREDDATTATQGGMAGTIRYMSPEQVKNQNIDHRADIYALGMTLYEMLAGVLPFDPEEGAYAILKRIVEDPVPPPTRFHPNIPDGWVEIVQRAIAKDPAERFQNAEEMLDAVEALIDESAPAQSPPPRVVESEASVHVQERPAPRETPEARAKKLFASQAGRVAVPPQRPDPVLPKREPAPMPAQRAAAPIPEYEPPRPPRPKPPFKSILGGLLVVAVVAIGYPIVRSALSDKPTYPVDPPPIVEPASVRVTTYPEGALVYVDDAPVGITPLDPQKASGAVKISARLDGYADRDTTVVVDRGEVDVHLVLAAVPTASRTPVTPRRNTPPPPANPDNTNPTDPVPATPMGSLRMRVEPAGTMAVVGHEYLGGGTVDLPAGTHRVRCSSNGLSAEKDVVVSAGEPASVTCYTMHEVTIVTRLKDGSAGPWARIVIDGVDTEENTPLADHPMESGTHRIRVQKFGYRIEEGEQELVLRPTFERPNTVHTLEFTLIEETGGALRTRQTTGNFSAPDP